MKVFTLDKHGLKRFIFISDWFNKEGICLGRTKSSVLKWLTIFSNNPPDLINSKMVKNAYPLIHKQGISLVKPDKKDMYSEILVHIDTEDYLINGQSVNGKFFLEGSSKIICQGGGKKFFVNHGEKKIFSWQKAIITMTPGSKIEIRTQARKSFKLAYSFNKEIIT